MKAIKDRTKRSEDGFTMLELIVVVVIIGVLAGISIPVFNVQKKKATFSTLESDVKNAAMVMQAELIFAADPYSMLLPNFFVSNDENVVQINTVQSSADFFCIIGSNATYKDMFVYFDSAKGGMVNDGTGCGKEYQEVEESIEDEPTTTPTTEPVVSEPATEPVVEPSPEPTQNEGPKEGEPYYIPPTVKEAMDVPVPNSTCKGLLTEHIDAYVAMYGSLKYENLVSVMARLQSGNKEIADILKNTNEGKRAIAASKALQKDPTCSDYITTKSITIQYYFDDYAELTKAYTEMLNNLDDKSADSYSYTQAYKKLYHRVYGV